MYEGQDGELTPDFLADAGAYMNSLSYGASLLAVSPPQMRTIPVNQSIPVEHNVATYDQIRALVAEARGPFVVLKCICRQRMALKEQALQADLPSGDLPRLQRHGGHATPPQPRARGDP